MRPPRLLILIFCFIFLPILLTFLSLVTAEPRRGVDGNVPIAGRSSRLRALFAFNAPASLFPPSAIISLTDDNSTFFLARPAAFGPLLPSKGLNGQLWIGSGFSEDTLRKGVGTAGFQGELGCSDVPGWDKDGQSKTEKSLKETETSTPTNTSPDKESVDTRKTPDKSLVTADKITGPAPNDGTDDHLHHPLPASDREKSGENQPSTTHADIQSLQESAEIAGKVVLLSRGGCGFLEKVKWVQRRGGVALIVGDDTRGGSLITMYARGDTSNITIPAVFTSYTTAHLLSSLIPERAMLEGQAEVDPKKLPSEKQGSKPTTTKKAASKPTATTLPKKEVAEKDESSNVEAKEDTFSLLLSLLGWVQDEGHSGSMMEDSRRPPSSGNIDWVLVDEYDEDEEVSKPKATQSSKDKGKKTEKSSKNADNRPVDGDGFEIGVHDWRDPDLVPPKPSKSESSSTSGKNEDSKKNNKFDSKKGSDLKGGSITPGSGEYSQMIKVPAGADKTNKYGVERIDTKSSSSQGQSDEKGWFARHFGWNQGIDEELDRIMKSRPQTASDKKTSVGEEKQSSDEHVGLWVTITPTSMSTSPFFDTLLVLVVSPLITLTVVYALLLLRSRIRRRRWRAPKSVVERLPIRTYHTISSHSTTSSSSPRSPSPGSVTSTSPLLGTRPPREAHGRSRPRSQTVSGAVIHTHDMLSSKEGNVSGSDLWRRKYIGRQVECVVCLEEYVDGQSQVMSLPCGHEFHAECMLVSSRFFLSLFFLNFPD
jgi:PA domain/RING-like zinc finger